MFEFTFNFWSFLAGFLSWFLIAFIRIATRKETGIRTIPHENPTPQNSIVNAGEKVVAVMDNQTHRTIVE